MIYTCTLIYLFDLCDSDGDDKLQEDSEKSIPRSEQVHMMHMRRFLDELNEKVSEKDYTVLKTR